MKLAIFDIDGTIFRSSLLIQLCFGLVKNKVFPKSSLKEIEAEYMAWLNRKGSYEAYINKVVKIYVKHIKNKSFTIVKKIAGLINKKQKDRVYRYTRDLIKQFKRQKYFLVAVSGSPDYIVESYARAIGFHRCFGTRLEVINGRFTGKILNLDSALKKEQILMQLKNELPQADLTQSVAVGDTEGDIGILKMVGKPIAFNPNLNLLKQAKKLGWRIVLERKDVIYKILEFENLT